MPLDPGGSVRVHTFTVGASSALAAQLVAGEPDEVISARRVGAQREVIAKSEINTARPIGAQIRLALILSVIDADIVAAGGNPSPDLVLPVAHEA